MLLLLTYIVLFGWFDLYWLENRASCSDWRGSTVSKPEPFFKEVEVG